MATARHQLAWSSAADRDIIGIAEHIGADKPFAAIEQIDKIEEQAKALKEFPDMGRKGRVENTRELVVAGTPFIIVYKALSSTTIEIVRVLHGRQRWPSA